MSGAEVSSADLQRVFPGDSEMAERMRNLDWAATSLGSVEDWPENLRVAVRICLTSRFPILLWWGPELCLLYNDAYLPWLTEAKHPRALGRPGYDSWGEIWEMIGPMLDGVMRTGQATWSVDTELYYDRKLSKEEVYVTWSFVPILAADGQQVDGIFNPCVETTEKVVGARRLETLGKLGMQPAEARTVDAACQDGLAVLAESPRDISFAAIYVVGEGGVQATLQATMLPPGEHLLPTEVAVSDAARRSFWPLATVLGTKQPADCANLEAHGVHLRSTLWPENVRDALVLPIHAARDQLAGLLVVGFSPRRPIDPEYRTFFELVAAHIDSALSDARAYEAARKRAEAHAEIDRAKTAFFANVSHEFRTPLTLMLGPLEDALADLAEPLPPAQRRRLEIIQRSSLRLLKLVNSLLDFSRIEAGRVQAVYEPTDLAALTADLASTFRSACEKGGLRLVVDCPTLPESAYVDRQMWEKIVLNLVSNAFKFTVEGEISVCLAETDETVELTVADTGIGIPADELQRIFERFHRVDESRGRTYEGTGIGLALVQELVTLHGGSVRAKSGLGQGSTFIVSLPKGKNHLPAERISALPNLASTGVGASAFVEEALRWVPEAERPNAVEAAVRPSGPVPPQPRLIWADDNADMRDYVKRLLNDRYEVEAVVDGQAALEAAAARTPDLVLADVMMPRLDGFGLLQALRADPRTRTVPVILLSARAGEESRVEGLQAGADDYLVKPFSARELLARVGAHIEMDRVRKEAAQREHALLAEAESAAQRLEAVLESISDGFIALDRDWRYTAVNNQACESMGIRREEVLGRPIWELYPDTVGTPFEFELRRAVAEQQTVVFEYFFSARNRWYENRLYPAADGLSIFFAEVTERKQAEAALRASEAVLRRAYDELEARVGERTAELQHANASLHREAAERRRAELARTELLRRLVTAQEDERRRVAHDIHDGVTQLAAAAALHIDEALSLATELDDDPRHELDRARDLARRASAESRHLIAGLRPSALDDFGLVGALRQEIDTLQEVGWPAMMELDHTAHARFGPEVEITLYRVAQEALLNVRKHTDHVRVKVRLKRVDDEVRLEVRDWGGGFDPERAREGAAAGERVGVAGMRERLVLIGGRLEVRSARGRGTTICATVPLSKLE